MAKRHDDALTISAGACNPSGIAISIVEACRELRAEEGFSGTQQICEDPAIRLMVHQLAYITGVHNGVEDFVGKPDFSDCSRLCREAVGIDRPTAPSPMVQEPAQ